MEEKAWETSRVFFPSRIRKCGKWRWDFADGSANLPKEGYSGDNKMQSNGDGKMQIYIKEGLTEFQKLLMTALSNQMSKREFNLLVQNAKIYLAIHG